MGLQQSFPTGPPRADFELNDFHKILYQKGRRVLYEKALQCPCKSKAVNQQSGCKNCGSTGWIYINPKETRMLVTNLSVVTDYKGWSEEVRGMANITCRDDEQLGYMDRITLVDGKAIHQEVVHIKPINQTGTSDYFCWTDYKIQKMLFAGIFITINEKLTILSSNDFEMGPGNILKIKWDFINALPSNIPKDKLSISLRYYHRPVYYVLEMKRDTMQTFKYQNGGEVIQNMPVSAIARRSHYFQQSPNTGDDRFVDNSYQEQSCGIYGNIGEACDCECTMTITVVNKTPLDMMPFTFVNQNQVLIEHNQNTTLVVVQIYDQSGEQIEGQVQIVNANSIRVTFSQQTSGTIIIVRKVI